MAAVEELRETRLSDTVETAVNMVGAAEAVMMAPLEMAATSVVGGPALTQHIVHFAEPMAVSGEVALAWVRAIKLEEADLAEAMEVYLLKLAEASPVAAVPHMALRFSCAEERRSGLLMSACPRELL